MADPLTDNTPAPLWEFIPLEDFSIPSGVSTESVRKGIRGFFQSFRPPAPLPPPVVSPADVCEATGELLACVLIAPPLDAAAQALDAALTVRHFPEAPHQAVVAPPHSGIDETLAAWARQHEWPLVTPPDPESLADKRNDWLSQLPATGPLVMTRIERLFLRDPDGLDLIRCFMAWLAHRGDACLLGCDSWAWAYLIRAVGLDTLFPSPITLGPFDAQRLQRYFCPETESEGRLDFRQADNGRPILSPLTVSGSGQASADTPGPEKIEATDFLQQLAHASRGNPGVAAAIWHHSLQATPDTTVTDQKDGQALWVRPWSKVKLPVLLTNSGPCDLFVLHNLLIHGGLSEPLLARVVPFPRVSMVQSLHRLREATLIEAMDGRWQVSAIGYPAARKSIVDKGYLYDAF